MFSFQAYHKFVLLMVLSFVSFSLHADQPLLSNLTELEQLTSELKLSIPESDLTVLSPKFDKLKALKDQVGLTSYENFSLMLLVQARKDYEKNNLSRADFFVRRAISFSPLSPRVLFSCLSLANKLNISSPVPHFAKAIVSIFRSREFFVSIVASAIYPLLLVTTVTAHVLLLLWFVFRMGFVLQSFSRFFPLQTRGIMTPVAFIIAFVCPLFFGPLCTLGVWSLLAWICREGISWIPKLTGLVFLAWGLLVPVRDTLEVWRADESGKAFLRCLSGDFTATDRYNLEKLAKARSDDGVAWFLYGQLLRKYGALDDSQKVLARAKTLIGEANWITAEEGTLAFAAGDLETAKALYQKAKENNFESGALAFNQSRIALEELDTAKARSYIAEAQKLDPDLVELMKSREQDLGNEKNLVLADVPVPAGLVFRSLLAHKAKLSEGEQASVDLEASLIPGGTSMLISLFGLIFLVLSLVKSKGSSNRRTQTYFGDYRVPGMIKLLTYLIPGGPWVMGRRYLTAFASCWMICLIGLPVLGWPGDAGALLELMPDSATTIIISCSLLIAFILLAGIAFAEER